MNELGKISRIIDRELPGAAKEVLLVLDGTTGQNGLVQAKQFSEIAGVTGMMLANTANALYVWSKGVPQDFILGGAGAADGIVIAGITGVLLAELLGEIIERMKRGTQRPTRIFRNGEFVEEEEAK